MRDPPTSWPRQIAHAWGDAGERAATTSPATITWPGPADCPTGRPPHPSRSRPPPPERPVRPGRPCPRRWP